jgi:hypothetical protein
VADEHILSDAWAAVKQTHINNQRVTRACIWRTIMDSGITRHSVDATIILAASLVLLNAFGGHGVVLGEVAQRLGETRTVMHKERRVAWRPGEDKPFFEGEARKYISTDIGFMEEQYDPNGTLLYRAFLLKEGQVIVVFPRTKRYIKFPARGRLYDELVKMTTPTGMVNYFTAMPYTNLGRSRVAGVEAKGFEASHMDFSLLPDYARRLFPIQDLSARLWVDAESSLPVEIEMKMDVDRGLMTWFQKIHAEFTAYDFEWNVGLPEAILDPNVPPDYTRIDLGSVASDNAAWFGVGALPIIGLIAHRRRRRRLRRSDRAFSFKRVTR